VQLYRYFVSQSSEFCRHNPLCCFSTSVCLFRYRLSLGYRLDDRGSISDRGRTFCRRRPIHISPEAQPSFFPMGKEDCFPEVKWLDREADYLPPFSGMAKKLPHRFSSWSGAYAQGKCNKKKAPHLGMSCRTCYCTRYLTWHHKLVRENPLLPSFLKWRLGSS